MIEISIFFDIETLPTNRDDLIEMIAAKVTPPGTMKKPETIQKWNDEEKPAAVLEAIAKTALDGGTGRLASVALAIGDGEVSAATSAGPDGYDVDVERNLLRRFYEKCESVKAEFGVPPILIGHNIVGFDIRWLWKRSIVLGIRPPNWWPHDAKPWDADRVEDTMLAWEGHGGRISQDRLARILGLQGKGDVDGSQVAALWAAGRFEDIRVYNGDDVSTCREIWRRITGHVPPPIDVTDQLMELEEAA